MPDKSNGFMRENDLQAGERTTASLRRKASRLQWWYDLTAPAEPAEPADFVQRELFRRAQLASLILLGVIIVVVAMMAAIFVIHNINYTVFYSTSIVLPILTIAAAIFNRQGKVTLAAIIMIVEINGGIAITVLTAKGGLGLVNLPLYDLLIGSELIAVSLLAPQRVFLMAAINSAFIAADVMLQPHAANLDSFIASSGEPVIIMRPILLQVAVAFITYLWVRSALNALRRADRAETVAALERKVAEQQRAEAEKKRQLDRSIQYLVETQSRVANGDFTARVPLSEDNVLWQVAGAFNNMLTRFQYLQREAQEFQRIQQEISNLANRFRKAQEYPVHVKRSSTALDALLIELARLNVVYL